MSDTSYKVTGPVIQHLGFQGDQYLLKVVFPIHAIQDGSIEPHDVEHATEPAGMRAIIFKFRTEDLPMHSSHADAIMHFDVGRAIKEHFGGGG